MGGSVLKAVVNPIGAYRDHKERKAEKAAQRQQQEAEAKLKQQQETSDQAARKSRGDNVADLEGLQDAGDDAGVPESDLAGLGSGGLAYDLRKRKLLGGGS